MHSNSASLENGYFLIFWDKIINFEAHRLLRIPSHAKYDFQSTLNLEIQCSATKWHAESDIFLNFEISPYISGFNRKWPVFWDFIGVKSGFVAWALMKGPLLSAARNSRRQKEARDADARGRAHQVQNEHQREGPGV